MGESERLEQAIPGVYKTLAAAEVIAFAVVFGPFVDASAATPADIDIAVKFSDELASDERFHELCWLSGHLQASNRPFVDIADIEQLPLAIAHDAVQGELVYGSEERFDAYRRQVEQTFAARRETIRSAQQELIDRIADQGLHG